MKVTITETRVYTEPCDCGDRIRHNNGGNYHDRINVVAVSGEQGYCVLVEETTTRENFPADKFEVLLFREGQFELEWQDRLDDPNDGIATFREGEARIVFQQAL